MFFKREDSPTPSQIPSPYVWQPSGKWDGNDGDWTSFMVNIGATNENQGYNFRVLPYTSSSLTLLPRREEWCDAECALKRGAEPFDGRESLGFAPEATKWNDQGQFDIPRPEWWPGSQYNDTGKGNFGFSMVGLGPSDPATSPMIDGLWVVRLASREFFMGSFGLGVDTVSAGSASKVSFLAYAANRDVAIAPSVSYAYTAGAKYKNGGLGTHGSLILGGYDQTRFIDQKTTIPMNQDRDNTLYVGVQSIIYRTDPDRATQETSFTAEEQGFNAVIDSTLPYLYLPEKICEKFEKAFSLKYDPVTKFYLISDQAHKNNGVTNATVSFKIGRTTTNVGDSTNIVLPYSAFALELSSTPLFPNATRYFPIRRSPDEKYVLGRAFLQEAYLIVDYERRQFQLAPAAWPSPAPSPTVIPIYSTDYVHPTPTPLPSKSGLAPGAIAGIVVGILAAVGLISVTAFLLWRRRRNQIYKEQLALANAEKTSEIDTTQAGRQIKHRRISELDSEPATSPRLHPAGPYYGPASHDPTKEPFPPITEMESPPAELWVPPPGSNSPTVTPGSERTDYFIVASKVRPRGATRDSSNGPRTPGTPRMNSATIAELPGHDVGYTVDGQHFERVGSPASPQSPASSPGLVPTHARGPSDTSLSTNIDEVLADHRTAQDAANAQSQPQIEQMGKDDTLKERDNVNGDTVGELARRPSHTRGLSNDTVQSASTGVSAPSPEEVEAWDDDHGPTERVVSPDPESGRRN